MRATDPIPQDLARDMVYGSSGPRGSGVVFLLRLEYRDETVSPPAPGRFEHEWVVPRAELDRAEREGRIDRLLMQLRSSEERLFLRRLERIMRRDGTRLLRVGRDLALRRGGPFPEGTHAS